MNFAREYLRLREGRSWPEVAVTLFECEDEFSQEIEFQGIDGGLLKGYIFGYDDLCGDPLIAVITQPGWSVFTATHGESIRTAHPISAGLTVFFESLSLVADVLTGRLTIGAGLREIELKNGTFPFDLEFWTVFFEE